MDDAIEALVRELEVLREAGEPFAHIEAQILRMREDTGPRTHVGEGHLVIPLPKSE